MDVAHRLREPVPMTDIQAASAAGPASWTCPFCPLACDHLGVDCGAPGEALALRGADCARARRALAGHDSAPAAPPPEIEGQATTLDAALETAARWLAASRQPLFGGLGTDVAGARALYPLACATGAICDPAGGDALMHGLRALQDRGQFTTTLAEVRTRADLIVLVGGTPGDLAPLLAQRCGIGEDQVPDRRVVSFGAVLGGEAGPEWAAGGRVDVLPLHGDLFTTVSMLAALVAQQRVPAASAGLAALAQALRAARYAVLVGTPAHWPVHGALIVERVHQLIGTLNRDTRAAALWIGGGNGVATVNQVFTWLSGLPLRSRAGPHGLEHEPLAFDAARLLADGAVDALLWVASFDAGAAPPPTALPTVVLGHPALAATCRRPGALFIPVATPGIGSDGHLFRTDGTVLMPLAAVRADGLPTVAAVAQRLLPLVAARRVGQ